MELAAALFAIAGIAGAAFIAVTLWAACKISGRDADRENDR